MFTDKAITKNPRGSDNVHPLGDRAINLQSNPGPIGGEDIDGQPQKGSTADYENVGARVHNFV